jgi:hypothetical protein
MRGPCAQHGPLILGTPDLRWGEGGQDTDTALHAAATVLLVVSSAMLAALRTARIAVEGSIPVECIWILLALGEENPDDPP